MERFILDTSIFTNPDVYRQFGEDPQEAIGLFLQMAQKIPAEFYIPGSVYEELRLMRDIDKLAPRFECAVRIRSPRKFNLQIPAGILYEFIDEVRKRIDRGLRIAEEYAKLGLEAGSTRGDPAQVITRLRERYREALRRGIIDSREDVDVLLLAYEMDGVLLSADDGLRTWADKVGVKIMLPQHLRLIMEQLVEYQAAAE